MGSSGLLPGLPDHSAPELPAEVARPKLAEGLTGSGEQPGQQRSLVGEEAGGEVVFQG